MSSRKFTEVKQNGENTSVVIVTSGIFVEKRYQCLAKSRFQFSVAMQNKFAVSNLASCCNRTLRIMKAWNLNLFFPCLYCLARFARWTKKRKTTCSWEQSIGSNAKLENWLISLLPLGAGRGWLLSLSYVNERSAVGKISKVFQILEFCQKINWKISLYVWTIHSNTLLNRYTFWIELLNSMMREKTQLRLLF